MLQILKILSPVRLSTTETTNNEAVFAEDEKFDSDGHRVSSSSDKDAKDRKAYAESSHSVGEEEAATSADPSLNPGGLSFDEG